MPLRTGTGGVGGIDMIQNVVDLNKKDSKSTSVSIMFANKHERERARERERERARERARESERERERERDREREREKERDRNLEPTEMVNKCNLKSCVEESIYCKLGLNVQLLWHMANCGVSVLSLVACLIRNVLCVWKLWSLLSMIS